jgi:hypothetical protein
VSNHRWLLVGGAVFMVGALFFCLGLFDWLEIGGLDERFQQYGRTVQGTVLTKTITSSSSVSILKRPQSSNPNYYVTYRFSTPEGKEFEGSAGVYSETWHNLAEGGPVQIMYLPAEPLTNRTEGRTDLGSAIVSLLMGGLLALGGGALVFWDLRRFLRKR